MAIFQIEGEEVIEKIVGPGGTSAQIYLHKKYTGRRVKVVILSNNGVEADAEIQEEKGDVGGELA